MRREYPDHPLVGVGAVVVREDGCVLLVQRRQPPRAGEWSLPGGLVELGELLDEAVWREVREECGIEVQVGPLVGVFQPIERDAAGAVRFHYVVLDYLACYAGGTLRTSSDVSDAVWVPPDQLDQYRLRPETMAMIRRALAIRQSSESSTTSEIAKGQNA